MWLMRRFHRFLLGLGFEICEYCGSPNVVQQGYLYWHHRHVCRDCKKTTWVIWE